MAISANAEPINAPVERKNDALIIQAIARLRPYVERARTFSGWDLSTVPINELEAGPPWDYESLARKMGRAATSALDMGTGGGEVLARLRDSLPSRVTATEEWHVNAPIAKQRLAPLGVDVVRAASQQLPFKDTTFDLVLNRHEELDPSQVGRVLQPGGHVITQQVGRNNWRELGKYFPRKNDFGDLRGAYTAGFEAAGLRVILSLEHDRKIAYPTLGEVVYILTIAPWEIPNFDIERDIEALLALEADCQTEAGLVMTESRFLLIAEKPEV